MNMSIIKLPLSLTVYSMRRGDESFRKNNKTFGNFNVKKDLSYIVDDEDFHKLDIYSPVANPNGITLFYVHGGGYVYGDKTNQDVFASWFVNKGFTVVVINYRLGEKDGSISIMDQVSDTIAALKFIEREQKYYSLPMDNFFLMGDSAGGHICLMIDILLKNKDVQKYYGISDLPNVKIDGIALNSPMYDYSGVIKLGEKLLTRKGLKWMFSEKYKDEEFVRFNNPRQYYQNGFKPLPLFASTSYHDYFNSQTNRLKRDCDKLGIELDYLFEASPNPKIDHVYNHFRFNTEEAEYCNERMVEFFLKNSKVAK